MTIRCQYKKGSAKNLIRDNPALATYNSDFRMIWASYVMGSTKMGRVFQLTPEEFDVLIHKKCTYCGEPPVTRSWGSTKNTKVTYNGLDRVDNAEGYVTGNVVPCCPNCNRAKKGLTAAEYIQHAKKVVAHNA